MLSYIATLNHVFDYFSISVFDSLFNLESAMTDDYLWSRDIYTPTNWDQHTYIKNNHIKIREVFGYVQPIKR